MLEYVVEHWDDGNDLILSRCHLSLLLPSLAYYFPFALELIKNRESESKRQHSETNCREKHKLKHFSMKVLLLGGVFWEEPARRNHQGGICRVKFVGRDRLEEYAAWKLLGGIFWEESSGWNLLGGICREESSERNLQKRICREESAEKNLQRAERNLYRGICIEESA